MSVQPCPKCGQSPCMCRPWCPSKWQCLCDQHNQYHCAGPLIYTGEDNIGDRPCCMDLKKCTDPSGLRQWCSHTGKCPGEGVEQGYPPAPPPFQNYSNILVKEKFTFISNGQGIL